MALHLVKLCVGIGSVEELAAWQRGRLQALQRSGAPQRLFHSTFQTPKRQAEVLDGGSLYWVIKGAVQARQRITGFEDGHKPDGSHCCLILLDPELVAVRPVPRAHSSAPAPTNPTTAPTLLTPADSRGPSSTITARTARRMVIPGRPFPFDNRGCFNVADAYISIPMKALATALALLLPAPALADCVGHSLAT